MAFGHWGRTPQEVQYHNGGRFDFNKVRERYEQTKPLQGKRKALDIRPIGERDRCHERMVKVSDNEYYVTHVAYRYYDNHPEHGAISTNRSITYRLDGDVETIIVHTPRAWWGENLSKPFEERRFNSSAFYAPSEFYFYYYNLPTTLSVEKYKGTAYLAVGREEGGHDYFTLLQGDVHVTRKVGEKFFKPKMVHRETIRSIDRKKSKEIRQAIKPFADYLSVIIPLIESNAKSDFWRSDNPFDVGSGYPGTGEKLLVAGKSWQELLIVPEDQEPPEAWYAMAKLYKKRVISDRYDYAQRTYVEIPLTPQRITEYIARDVYRVAKPFKLEEVPLGKMAHSRYKNW